MMNFTVESQLDFLTNLKRITKGKRSHILFLKDVPVPCIDAYIERGMLKSMKLRDSKRTYYQYYITEKFIELTYHL